MSFSFSIISSVAARHTAWKLEKKKMAKLNEKQVNVLDLIDKMVCQYTAGKIADSQKSYECLLDICEDSQVNFEKTLEDGIRILKSRCIGIQDFKKYDDFICVKIWSLF